MRHIWIWAVTCLLILHLMSTGWTHSESDIESNIFGMVPSDGDDDGDGYSPPQDCDDNDSTVYPEAEEVCDGKDNDCDGEVDEDCISKAEIWVDKGCESRYNDGDDVVVSFIVYSPAPTARVSIISYCGDASEYLLEDEEYATRIEHSIIDTAECLAGQVRLVIEATVEVEGKEMTFTDECIFYVCFDNDADGFTTCDGDCDDNDSTVYPEAEEVCDGKDNDCDGEIDEGDVDLHVTVIDMNENAVEGALVEVIENGNVIAKGGTYSSGRITFSIPAEKEYTVRVSKGEKSAKMDIFVSCADDHMETITLDVCEDKDGDGYFPVECGGTDCDDNDSWVYPGADEVCDGKDNDCDGEIDEDCIDKVKMWIDKGCKSTYNDGDEVVISFIVYSTASTATVLITNYCGDTSETVFEGDILTNEVQTATFAVQCPADKERLESTLKIEATVEVEGTQKTDTSECVFYVYHVKPVLGDRNSAEIWVDRGCESTYDDGDEAVVSFIVYSVAPTATVSITNYCGKTSEYICEDREYDTNTVHNIPVTVHCFAGQAKIKIGVVVEVEGTRIGFENTCIFYVCSDKDGDGFTTCGGDCDDNDRTVYPGAEEVCDGKDNDCDGEVDEGDVDLPVTVVDNKGNAVEGALVEVFEEGERIALMWTPSEGKVTFKVPGNREYTIRVSKGEISKEESHKVPCKEEDIPEIKIVLDVSLCEDKDRDGFTTCDGDCDDKDNTVYPGARDLCDGKDNDCDKEIDEDSEDLVKIWVSKGCGSTYINGDEVVFSFIICSSASFATVLITYSCAEDPIIQRGVLATNKVHTERFTIKCSPGQEKLETLLDIEVKVAGREIPSADCIFYVCFNEDGDGFTTCDGDCNDNDENIHPEADENYLDFIDNNCDGWIPEALIFPVIFGGVFLLLVVIKKKYKEKLFQEGGL